MKIPFKAIVIISVSGLVLLIFCLPLLRSYRVSTKAPSCFSNLKLLSLGVQLYASDNNGIFPDSLQRLVEYKPIKSHLGCFICPSTKHEPGESGNIVRWTDYIYNPVSDPNSPSDSVVIYCPPEHHRGEYGHIAFLDGEVKRVATEEFEKTLTEQDINHVPKGP